MGSGFFFVPSPDGRDSSSVVTQKKAALNGRPLCLSVYIFFTSLSLSPKIHTRADFLKEELATHKKIVEARKGGDFL